MPGRDHAGALHPLPSIWYGHTSQMQCIAATFAIPIRTVKRIPFVNLRNNSFSVP